MQAICLTNVLHLFSWNYLFSISLWLSILCFVSDICNIATICMNTHTASEEKSKFIEKFRVQFQESQLKNKNKNQLFFDFFFFLNFSEHFITKNVKRRKMCARSFFEKFHVFIWNDMIGPANVVVLQISLKNH